MAQLEFDEETSKRIEAAYSSRDVLRRRALVREAVGARPGDRILDVGCGPGFYVAELLDEVGPEGSVVGVDGSDSMLALAAHRNETAANVEFLEADATSLPVADGDFDAALSVQVLEYVADVPAALAEIHRALRPGGRVALWDVDWATLSMRTADPERMRRVLDAWDEHLTHVALPRTLTGQLPDGGLRGRPDAGPRVRHQRAQRRDLRRLPRPLHRAVRDRPRGAARGRGAGLGRRAAELAERGEFYFAVIQFLFSATRGR